MADFVGNERFAVVRLLGKGGYGNVYQVFDKDRGEHKALKALHKLDPEGLFRLKTEFRALVDLSHPNLVRLEELFAEGDAWFMTLELIDGVALLVDVCDATADEITGEIVSAFSDYETFRPGEPAPLAPNRPRGARRFNEKKLRASLRQLVDGLNYLHQTGLCHRDLKPANVLVEKNGRLVLVDFGLSQAFFVPQTDGDAVEGTPVYMSPEQLAGEPVGPASDWYSVGVMLYEILTGVLPYDGSNLYLALQKKSERPRSPQDLVANLPFDLAQLCVDLLSPNPSDRPTGTQLLGRLGRSQKAPRFIPAVAEEIPSVIENHRIDDAEAALALALEQVRLGQSVVIHLAGPSGSGKTTLLRHLIERVRQSDPTATLLVSRCRVEESVRYRTLDGLVDSAIERLTGLGDEVAFDGAALAPARAAFPLIGRLDRLDQREESVVEVADALDSTEVAESLSALFGPLGERGVLVLAIDDLSSGDVPGAILLGQLLGQLPCAALLVVAVHSEGDAAPWQALTDQLEGVRIKSVLLQS